MCMFQGLDPKLKGLEAFIFPAPMTEKPPIESPSSCVWAVISCCAPDIRLKKCFDAHHCPGIDWDPSPCKESIVDAARTEVEKFYATK